MRPYRAPATANRGTLIACRTATQAPHENGATFDDHVCSVTFAGMSMREELATKGGRWQAAAGHEAKLNHSMALNWTTNQKPDAGGYRPKDTQQVR